MLKVRGIGGYGAAIVVAWLLVCVPVVAQTTRYVDDDTCPLAGTGKIGDPFCSIQAGINAAAIGDTVEVAPGTYFEDIDLFGKAITLISSGGAALTIIDGGGVQVVDCHSGEGPNTVIDGFTITNGFSTNAGGMRNLNSSPTVRNCIFLGNSAAIGGAMFNVNSTASFTNCLFDSNSATSDSGAIRNSSSSPTFTNCTFSFNTAPIGAVIRNIGSFPTLINCILWDNGSSPIDDFSGATTINYSDVEGGWFGLGSNNINLDPLFIGPLSGDFRLDRFSPCIDAGDNDGVPVGVTTDLDDNLRFVDDAGVADTGNAGPPGPPITDMGAYERQIISGPITIFINPGESIQAAIDDPGTLDGDTLVLNPGTYFEAIVFQGKAITLRSTDPLDPAVVAATTINGTGFLHVVQCVSGEGAGTVLDGITITGGNANGIAPADRRGGGMHNDGASPTVTNCRFISNAADDLGGGMYNVNVSNPIVMNCTFSLNTSDDGGGMANVSLSAPSVSDCQFLTNSALGAGGGIYNISSTPVVTNCIFDGNDAGSRGGGMHNQQGDATIAGCLFINNSVPFAVGGGMYNILCNPIVTDCRFIGNTSSDGAGMQNDLASPIVTNCIFSGNTSGVSGTMFNNGGSPVITNCTFSGNQVTLGGGAITSQGSSALPIISNCIFWGNLPDEILDISSGVITVNDSDIQGGWAGAGANNIAIDPLYLDPDGADNIVGTLDDDLRLFLASPCIDIGNNATVPPAVITDLDGTPRILDGDYDGSTVVDMGAYEFDPDAIALVVNLTQQTSFPGIASSIGSAVNGDVLAANLLAVNAQPSVNFNGKAITLNNLNGLAQPAGGLHILADSAALTTPSGLVMTFNGELRILLGDRVDLQADLITIAATGLLSVKPGAIVDVSAPSGLSNSGSLSMLGGVLGVSGVLQNEATGTLTAYGDLVADIINDNQATYIADTQVLGDYVNNGTTTVQSGVLTIIGSLTDNGVLIGDVSVPLKSAAQAASTIGLTVLGDYAAGSGASLLMPSAAHLVRVEGNFDVAINDNANYDMAQAELRMIGLNGAAQNLEIMSLDIGAASDGMDRTFAGHYPLGLLRIGPSATTVNMVDNHDNDNQGQVLCEAIYVRDLIIDAGATLNTNGCPVYYETLVLNGVVDDPLNIIALPLCLADFSGDNSVTVTDLLSMLAAWGPCGASCPHDLNDDGVVSVLDLLALLAAWGVCP